jgi:hypothetical protein
MHRHGNVGARRQIDRQRDANRNKWASEALLVCRESPTHEINTTPEKIFLVCSISEHCLPLHGASAFLTIMEFDHEISQTLSW